MPSTMTSVDGLQRVGRALSNPTRAEILVCLARGAAYPGELAERVGDDAGEVSDAPHLLAGLRTRPSLSGRTQYSL